MRPVLKINVFQHVAFEGLGAMEPWLADRGHRTDYIRLFAGAAPPAPDAYDWLIVMGGPMGVHDEGEFPWLKAEKAALRAALKSGKPILGICLGAQLLADVLGAHVGRNRNKEIGWHPVHASVESKGAWPGRIFPERLTTFHWHGDTFALPVGAVQLASSEGCLQQAFSLDEKVVGLQFHPEATPAGITALIAACASDIAPGPYVQPVELLPGNPELHEANLAFLGELLSGLESRALAAASSS